MSFKIENFGSDASNAKSILGGVCYYRYYNKDNNTVTTAGYFPASLGLQLGDRITVIPSTKTSADEEYIVSDITNRVVTVTKVEAELDLSKIVNANTLPTASATELGNIYLYTGETNENYTHGYIYECVSAGEPAVYSWSALEVQASADGLPDQTGNSGKFLTTDGTDASWSDKPLANKTSATGSLSILGYGSGLAVTSLRTVAVGVSAEAKGNDSIAIGNNTVADGASVVALGKSAYAAGTYSTVLGTQASASANYAIQLGKGSNSDANTFKVANNNGNFEIMSADGTIPAARLASITGLADGNYKPRLTISDGVPTITWVAE